MAEMVTVKITDGDDRSRVVDLPHGIHASLSCVPSLEQPRGFFGKIGQDESRRRLA